MPNDQFIKARRTVPENLKGTRQGLFAMLNTGAQPGRQKPEPKHKPAPARKPHSEFHRIDTSEYRRASEPKPPAQTAVSQNQFNPFTDDDDFIFID